MTINDYYTVSDSAILKELGNRVRALRLRKGITQEELGQRVLLAVGTIKSLEAGKGKLSTLVSVMRELGALEQLDQFIPPISISPLGMVRDKGRSPKARMRARRTIHKDETR